MEYVWWSGVQYTCRGYVFGVRVEVGTGVMCSLYVGGCDVGCVSGCVQGIFSF